MAVTQTLALDTFGLRDHDDERFLTRISGDEHAIEQERVYTHTARAIETAMLDRGPAGSLDFWASVKALHEVSKAQFLPRFIINRVRLIEHYTGWDRYINQLSVESTAAPGHNEIDNTLIDAKKNFQDIVKQIRSPTFTLSAELLALGEQALESLRSRKG